MNVYVTSQEPLEFKLKFVFDDGHVYDSDLFTVGTVSNKFLCTLVGRPFNSVTKAYVIPTRGEESRIMMEPVTITDDHTDLHITLTSLDYWSQVLRNKALES